MDLTTRVLSRADLDLEPLDHPASLVIIYGGELGRRYPIDSELTLGRAISNSVLVDADSVSRHHARIARKGERSYIDDLGSTNGTTVNGERVEETRLLLHGDLIKIGRVVFRYICGHDVETHYHEEIYRLTIIDGLTQVHNRRYFDDFLDREVARSTRSGAPLSLIFFDVDQFKRLNDRYGHLFGDRLLREIAQGVKNRVRREQLIARFGGDEFALLLPDVDLENATVFAEKIRRQIQELELDERGHHARVTLSLGVATLESEMSVHDLLQTADRALLAAKHAGRNCWRTVQGAGGVASTSPAANV
jgi:diguanylate cyclase (GGDEF)-like protein